VAAGFRKRLSEGKREGQKLRMWRCNVKRVNDVEVKEQYMVKRSNRFGALETLVTVLSVRLGEVRGFDKELSE
jgi:hypothetical protein